jgi:hypothetical protein
MAASAVIPTFVQCIHADIIALLYYANHRTPKYLTNLGLGRFAVDSVQLLQ